VKAGEAKHKKGITKTLKLPEWDITPGEAALSLAQRIHQALGDGAVTPERIRWWSTRRAWSRSPVSARQRRPGYNQLSNVTGVDYLGRTPRFEVVYPLLHQPGPAVPLVLKARAMKKTRRSRP